MTRCELCNQGDPSITVRCHKCRETFHLHRRQLNQVEEGTIILGDCPGCGTVNCWQKAEGKLAYSGPIIDWGQPIIDLRGSR